MRQPVHKSRNITAHKVTTLSLAMIILALDNWVSATKNVLETVFAHYSASSEWGG